MLKFYRVVKGSHLFSREGACHIETMQAFMYNSGMIPLPSARLQAVIGAATQGMRQAAAQELYVFSGLAKKLTGKIVDRFLSLDIYLVN
jgi:hypothetical protein